MDMNFGKGRDFRKWLESLREDGTIDENYRDHPMYKMGLEDGEDMGFDVANQRYQEELRSLRTMIDAMIDSK